MLTMLWGNGSLCFCSINDLSYELALNRFRQRPLDDYMETYSNIITWVFLALHFADMIQTNKIYGTKRNVTRWPSFRSSTTM